jgi:hypothetical protein
MTSPTSAPARRDIDLLMGIWFVVVVTFFSLPRSKLVGYVLPALPPLAWCVARALARVLPGDARYWMSRPAWRWSVAAAVVLCLGALGAAARFAVAPGARLRLPADLRVGAQDRVVILDRYFYELPFYWDLRRPVLMMGDWRQAEAMGGDDWRREVVEAGRFEPDIAQRVLIGPWDLFRVLCEAPVTWLIGESADSLRATGLADAHIIRVAGNDRMTVWRVGEGFKCDAPSMSVTPD